MDGNSKNVSKKSDHIETSQNPVDFEDWPEELVKEMRQSHNNGCVGSVLVSETSKVRVWHLRLPPGYRCPFHRHVNPYFWSSHNDGRARNYFSSGVIKEVIILLVKLDIFTMVKTNICFTPLKISARLNCYLLQLNSLMVKIHHSIYLKATV